MSSQKSTKITVSVRVRPRNDREKELRASDVIAVSDGKITVSKTLDNDQKSFNFDIAYSSDLGATTFGSQERIYNEIGLPILDEALEGINQCLFAYGQTGSGKSYTMTGYEDPGIIPRLTEDLFKRVASSKGEIKVWVSYMEIYNEHIHDLLRSDHSEEENLSIFEHQKLGVVVPDATVVPVASIADVNKLMEQGLTRRVSASTSMNATSSRSHAIYTLHIESKNATSRINLIDLAGSERISKTNVSGENHREAAMINQSLTNLGLVIKALSEKKDFVPFRNSKLTFLLKDSLSGNSRTYMIANISPAESEVEETISTLRFASNVKRITTAPQVNYGTHEDLVNALRSEIDQLRAELAAKNQSAENPDLNGTLKLKAAVLRMVKSSVNRKLEKEHKRQSLFILEKRSPYLLNVSWRDPADTGPLSACIPGPGDSLVIGSGDALSLTTKDAKSGMAVIERRSDLIFLQAKTDNVFLNNRPVAVNGNEIELFGNDLLRFGADCTYRLVLPDSVDSCMRYQPPCRPVLVAAKQLEDRIKAAGLEKDCKVRIAALSDSEDLDEQIFIQVKKNETLFEFYDVSRFDLVFQLLSTQVGIGSNRSPNVGDIVLQLEQLELRVNSLHKLILASSSSSFSSLG